MGGVCIRTDRFIFNTSKLRIGMNNDTNLMTQMIKANHFNWEIYQLLCKQNDMKSKAMIESMGNKWVCHKDNQVKKLDVPLDILGEHKSKLLKRR